MKIGCGILEVKTILNDKALNDGETQIRTGLTTECFTADRFI
jgi:hypothetical protein